MLRDGTKGASQGMGHSVWDSSKIGKGREKDKWAYLWVWMGGRMLSDYIRTAGSRSLTSFNSAWAANCNQTCARRSLCTPSHAYVACVCMCVRERRRERESIHDFVTKILFTLIVYNILILDILWHLSPNYSICYLCLSNEHLPLGVALAVGQCNSQHKELLCIYILMGGLSKVYFLIHLKCRVSKL